MNIYGRNTKKVKGEIKYSLEDISTTAENVVTLYKERISAPLIGESLKVHKQILCKVYDYLIKRNAPQEELTNFFKTFGLDKEAQEKSIRQFASVLIGSSSTEKSQPKNSSAKKILRL